MTLKPTPTLFALSLVALATTAQAETERQLGAHEHGAAQLTLAAENQTLVVGLDTPAFNLVGFEQAPASDAQRDQVESALTTLARADAVLDLPAAAQCTLVTHAVGADHWEGIEAHEDHEDEYHDDHAEEHHDDHEGEHNDDYAEAHHDDHEHEDHDHDHAENAHSEVLVEWTYRCENLDALRTVTVSAFEHFPNLTDLQVQYLGDDWQGAAQLTPGNTRLDLN